MLPPSGQPNKSSRGQANRSGGLSWFPGLLAGLSLLHSLGIVPSSLLRIQNPTSGLWHRFPYTLSSAHFEVLQPSTDDTKTMSSSQISICSECIHSNFDVCGLKHLFDYRRYIFPLQTIQTTSDPENKTKKMLSFPGLLVKIKSENQPTKQTPPLVVIDIFRRLPLLPSFFGLYPKHSFLGSDVQAAAVKNL